MHRFYRRTAKTKSNNVASNSARKGLSFTAVFALLLGLLSAPVGAKDVLLDDRHKGIRFVVVKANGNPPKGVEIVAPKEAKRRMVAAYDLLRRKSAFSAKRIDTLRRAGDVLFIYNPAYRAKEFGKTTIAVFVARDRANKKPLFPVIVTGFGIHWGAEDLASVVAHELVGHGTQHLQRRMKRTRNLELECEAWLYEERAYQDLGVDKKRKDIIDFRKQLENIWCADFRLYQRRNDPKGAEMWNTMHPNVTGLVEKLHLYTKYLSDTGVIDAVREAKKKESERSAPSR